MKLGAAVSCLEYVRRGAVPDRQTKMRCDKFNVETKYGR